ncbi:MAG TPA: translation elongation factor G, partial [Bacteroides sp.]|nr:translation elongation factor G [Bacteroides sp.]
HTEGGDFRQATYRAVRQGLRSGRNILLEPWFDFRLEVPADNIGKAMSDVTRMHGEFQPPVTEGDKCILTGSAPAAAMRDYSREVTAYTRGHGRLTCTLKGYEPCHNAEEVIAGCGYDPEADTANPTGSVFCAHGAGFVVPWYEVRDY